MTGKKATAKKTDGASGSRPKAIPKTKDVTVACRPYRLVEYIENLNESQIAAVKRIGFGGLLDLKISFFPHGHVPLFQKHFLDGSYVFRVSRQKEFMVSKYDVHDCFLIPFGPNPLPLVPTGSEQDSNSPENMALKDCWRERYGVQKVSSAIPLGKVFKELEDDTEGGDNFCCLFVLVSMSSFLAPTSNNGIDLKLLRAIENVSAFPEMDWCSYVLDSLVKAGKASLKNPTLHRGCIPFLMITYFQRFDYGGKVGLHDLPLIKHWDEPMLVSRIKGEMDNGGLGRLTPSEVKYPRCRNMSLNVSLDEPMLVRREDKCILEQAQSHPLLTASPHPTTSKKFIQIELPPGVEDDEGLKARSVDGTHELYLQMQRNAVVFHSWYADAILKIKHATTDTTGVVASQSTQEFLGGEKIHQYVAEVEDIAERLKHSVRNAPEFQVEVKVTLNKDDEHDESMHKINEVLRQLSNDGDAGELDAPADNVCHKENAEVPDKGVVVSWSEIMEEVGGELRDQDFGVRSEAGPASTLELKDELTASEIRDMMREAMYTEEDIQKAFQGAEAAALGLAQDTEAPHSGCSPVVNKPVNEDAKFNAVSEENEHPSVRTLQNAETVFSTAVLNDVIGCRLGEATIGLNQEGATGTVLGDPKVVTDVVEANPSEEIPHWSVSQIPLTFCSTADLKEAFRGVDQAASGCQNDEGEVDVNDGKKHEPSRLTRPVYVPRSDLSEHPFLLHSSTPLLCMDAVPENLGCSLDCGAPDPDQHVSSQFLRLNKDNFSKVFILRKEVMDYIFDQAHGFNLVEPLVTYTSPYCVAREEMLTLLPGVQVLNNVIDCWCLLLNHLTTENPAPGAISCCFFGLCHAETILTIWSMRKINKVVDHSAELRAVWDLWQAVCFSPFQLTYDLIEYLDNRSYDDDLLKLPYGKIALITVAELGKYMVSKGLEKWKKVSEFPLVNVNFKWQGVGYFANDCGVYTMVHMLLYRGELFDCNLGINISTDLLRAEIAAALVLSDVNTERENVLIVGASVLHS